MTAKRGAPASGAPRRVLYSRHIMEFMELTAVAERNVGVVSHPRIRCVVAASPRIPPGGGTAVRTRLRMPAGIVVRPAVVSATIVLET